MYRVNDQSISELIRIERTNCTFGGSCVVSVPPLLSAAKVYLRGARFACRKCHQLVYAIQSQDGIGRTWRRQARLGDDWSRPRGMHQRTYERLMARLYACEEQRDAAISAFLGEFLSRHPSLRDGPPLASFDLG